MKTTLPREAEICRAWYLINAENKVLGRLAVVIANLIRGKTKPIFVHHMDVGDYVVVVNARKVKLTGKKNDQKLYVNYSGYRHGLKSVQASMIRQRHPERMIYDAVKRMLPKNRLMRTVFQRLKVYADSEHPHAAQNPKVLEC
ncbi:MAG: 50S ribosomal protein L13 [Verrucomicrobia bacterium]|nr:50S ribosomal protein L13 [Verrucomicrobiota bacterium]MBU4290675.1 50S ribosomal protein L13 [Verrucomicrobiota bacterium]MBU4429383.1 50S ribosomal protein L13 [Verrucomicrobiota bacterium]MCG2681154.1 50S ribosomal protein L13 [Kiritimatiellia bacterium]